MSNVPAARQILAARLDRLTDGEPLRWLVTPDGCRRTPRRLDAGHHRSFGKKILITCQQPGTCGWKHRECGG
jgi:hypothetical protein